MAFDFTYPNDPPDERGWGPGWKKGMPVGGPRPASYPGEIVPLAVAGVSFPGGIRAELHDLATLLLVTSLDRGFIPHLDDPGCWGGAFRPTKRSSGSPDIPPGEPGSIYTTVPSNHSWYTALDINAPHNVYGADEHQIPAEMAALWRTYGWRWLGPPIKDWQHFDFAGTPADARAMTAQANEELVDDMTPEQLQKLKDSDARWQGALAYLEASRTDVRADPPAAKSRAFKEGWRAFRSIALRAESA